MTVNMYEELVKLISMLVPEATVTLKNPNIIVHTITQADLEALCHLYGEAHPHWCIYSQRCFSTNTGNIVPNCFSLYPHHYLNAIQMDIQWEDFITYYK